MNEEALRRIAQADQAAAELGRMAELATAYYRGLDGLPTELAWKLVRDWHWLAIHKGFWKDWPPVTGPGE